VDRLAYSLNPPTVNAVVDERTGLTNRLQALLKQYFPQALVLCGDDLWRPLATRFLLKWSSLQAVQKTKPATLKEFYYLNGSRSEKLMQQRLELMKKAVPDLGPKVDAATGKSGTSWKTLPQRTISWRQETGCMCRKRDHECAKNR